MARIIISNLHTADSTSSVENLSTSQLSVLIGGTDTCPVVEEEPPVIECLPPAPAYCPPPTPYVPPKKVQKW